jgi:hypothetical protein
METKLDKKTTDEMGMKKIKRERERGKEATYGDNNSLVLIVKRLISRSRVYNSQTLVS